MNDPPIKGKSDKLINSRAKFIHLLTFYHLTQTLNQLLPYLSYFWENLKSPFWNLAVHAYLVHCKEQALS